VLADIKSQQLFLLNDLISMI